MLEDPNGVDLTRISAHVEDDRARFLELWERGRKIRVGNPTEIDVRDARRNLGDLLDSLLGCGNGRPANEADVSSRSVGTAEARLN